MSPLKKAERNAARLRRELVKVEAEMVAQKGNAPEALCKRYDETRRDWRLAELAERLERERQRKAAEGARRVEPKSHRRGGNGVRP